LVLYNEKEKGKPVSFIGNEIRPAIYTEKNLNRGARTLYMYNGEAESCAKSIGRCTAMY